MKNTTDKRTGTLGDKERVTVDGEPGTVIDSPIRDCYTVMLDSGGIVHRMRATIERDVVTHVKYDKCACGRTKPKVWDCCAWCEADTNPPDVATFDAATGDKARIVDAKCPTCGKPSSGLRDIDGLAPLTCWQCTLTSTPAVAAVQPLKPNLDNAIEYPLYLNADTDLSSWFSGQCKGAIRISRARPPYAFGEDVAVVCETLPALARDIVARYNACTGISTEIMELVTPGRIAELLNERAELLAALQSAVCLLPKLPPTEYALTVLDECRNAIARASIQNRCL